MTTTQTAKAVPSPAAGGKEQAGKAVASPKVEMVTLDQLAREMKVPPREARMLLRLAAKQKSKYPTLGKEHVARQPWSWAPGSKALEEAKAALTAGLAD